MNNKLESVFHGYNVFNSKCELCESNNRVHSIQYIGFSGHEGGRNKEGVILVRPGYAKDYEVRSVLQHLWQELTIAGRQCNSLCFLFDMEHLSYSIKTINAAIAMYQVIRVFTTNGIGRIWVVNVSRHLKLFLKAIPLLKLEDLTIVKLEQLTTLLNHDQLQHLLPIS